MFPARTDIHIVRKLWHVGMGLSIVLAYDLVLTRVESLLLCASGLGVFVAAELLRIRHDWFNRRIIAVFGPFMRHEEVASMSSVPAFLCACMFVMGIFPKTIASLSMLYVSFGDPAASLAGILYGKHGPSLVRGKTLIGTLSAVLVCACVTFSYYWLRLGAVPNTELVLVSLTGGLIGGCAESLPLRIDDNMSIPLVSAVFLWAIHVWVPCSLFLSMR